MEVSSEDLVEFMTQMRLSVSTISKEIKTSNETLGKQIRGCKEELKGEIFSLHKKIEKEIEVVKEDLKNVNEEGIERMNKIEGRLDKMERDNEKQDKQKRKREDTEKGGEEESVNIQPARITYSEKLQAKQNEVRMEEETVPVYKSTWAKKNSQISLEQQLIAATEAAQRLETEDKGGESEFKRKERANRGKKLKLGDSLELHNPMDWPWDDSEQDWDGLIDRAARNKAKRVKEQEKKRKKLKKAIKVGRSSIGIGPIREQSFAYFNNITADYDEAKQMAAAKFLQEYLKFDAEDLSDINITDTKVSGKKDNILYIVLDSPAKVKDIRRRIADCRNEDIKTHDYISPMFYNRYVALGKHAFEMREGDPFLKTQIRFTDDDIALYTKTKGTDDPFVETKLSELTVTLPNIEYNVKWNMRSERQPMRRVSPEKRNIVLKSLGGSVPTSIQNEPRQKKLKVQPVGTGQEDGNMDTSL